MKIVFRINTKETQGDVTWEDGDFTGSEEILARVLTAIEMKTVSVEGYEKNYTGRAILKQAWTVLQLLDLEYGMSNVRVVEGAVDFPLAEEDPEDGTFVY